MKKKTVHVFVTGYSLVSVYIPCNFRSVQITSIYTFKNCCRPVQIATEINVFLNWYPTEMLLMKREELNLWYKKIQNKTGLL